LFKVYYVAQAIHFFFYYLGYQPIVASGHSMIGI